MRLLPVIFLLFVALSSAAQARGAGVWGYDEELLFFGPTKLRDSSGIPLSLCIKERQYALFFIPTWNTQEFVLSNNGCSGDSFIEYRAEHLISDRKAGSIPDTTPNAPPYTLNRIMKGFLLLILAAPLIVFVNFRRLKRLLSGKQAGRGGPLNAKPKTRIDLRGLTSDQANLIDVMTHAIKAAGVKSDQQIRLVTLTVNQVSAEEINDSQARDLINQARSKLPKNAFLRFGLGLDEDSRKELVYVALQAILVGGKPGDAAVNFVFKLAKGLGFSKKLVAEIIAENKMEPTAGSG